MARDVESPDYRYGKWGGNPKGAEQDPERCVERVTPQGKWIPGQCSFKRKFGLYCGKHRRDKSHD